MTNYYDSSRFIEKRKLFLNYGVVGILKITNLTLKQILTIIALSMFAIGNAQISIPYTENFSSIASANGFPTVAGGAWTRSGSNLNMPTYIANQTDYNRSGNGDTKFIAFRYDSGSRSYFVGPFNLTAGTSYSPSVLYKADGLTGFGPLAFTYGTTAAAATHTNTIASVPANIINTSFTSLSGSFTPAASGSYYIGIKITANGIPWYLTLDDFKMEVSPSCFAPILPVANASSATSANFSWGAPSTLPSAGYQWEVRTSGAGGSGATGLIASGSTLAGVLTASTSILTANTTYTFYVRSNCGSGDYSAWSTSLTFFTGYCVPPAVTTSATYINNFATTGAINNVSNLASGYTTGGYQNNYATANVTSFIGGVINTQISIVGGGAGITYWVDWNKNLEFETSEKVVNSASYLATGNYTASITVPAGTLNGDYRLRIKTDFNATNPAPCTNGGTAAETEDYKITIVTQPTDSPDLVSLAAPAATSTPAGSSGTTVNSMVFEAGLTDVEPGLSGQASGIVGFIGVSPVGANTNPNTWTMWIPATYDALVTGTSDGYKATIGATLPVGTYYYASRFSLNFGPYIYGGISSSNVGGIWDGTTYASGVLTVTPVTGDLCSTALSMPVDTTVDVTNVFASNSTDLPVATCGDFSDVAKDMWYSVVVPTGVNRMTVQTSTSSPASLTDTVIQVYRGTCGSLVAIGCNDDVSEFSGFSTVNLTGLVSGETILIRAWGYGSASGTFKLIASVPACPGNTTWNGTAWSNGVPTTGVIASISGNYTGPGFTACALEVTGTSQVVFTSGSNLTLNGLMNVASTASVTLESNANLVQTVNGSNTGNITVKRESAQLVRLDHTLWSSPVTGQKLFAFSPNTLTNRFYAYNTPTNTYSNSGLTATTDFIVAKGYGIRAANNHPETPATWMGSFTGNPNNGNKSFTLALTGTGFNLVGNPYPSVIDAAAFVTANTARINGTLYFYAHTLTMSTAGTFPAGTNYALWNATGQTAATLGTSGVPALVPNGKIQVGQGFLVKATAAGSANFTNAMREASNGNQFFRMASEVQSTNDAERHRFWLNLTNTEGTTFNQMLIGYVSGATQEVDNLYDGLAFGNEGSALSSRLADADYTIQGRALPFNQADVVPLSFKATTPGNYSISLADMDGVFAGDQNVYIRDNSNGSINNIKLAPFAFTSEAGTFNNRFDVVYQTALGTPESTFTANSVVAYIKNAQLNIQTKGNSMKAVSVYDVRGRLLFKQSGINNADFVAQGLVSQNQVLLVQVTSENDEVVTIKVMF